MGFTAFWVSGEDFVKKATAEVKLKDNQSRNENERKIFVLGKKIHHVQENTRYILEMTSKNFPRAQM